MAKRPPRPAGDDDEKTRITGARPLASAKTPATVTLKMLAAELAAQHSVPRGQADTLLADMVRLMVRHLESGTRVRLGGLGSLQVTKRPERSARNLATGETLRIDVGREIVFRPARNLKERI